MYTRDSRALPIPVRLYFIWGGANDYLTNDSPVEAAQNIGGYVSALAAAGAQHFLVPNLPDLSLTPLSQEKAMRCGPRPGLFRSSLIMN